MLEKEAFSLLIRRVWCMLESNAPINPATTTAVDSREPKEFREAIARVVLRAMTKEIGRTVVPSESETGDNFIDTVALAFAFLAEDERPAKYDDYTANSFAEQLITTFCTTYVALDNVSPTDETIGKCPAIEIPFSVPSAHALQKHMRRLSPTNFRRYPV